MFFDFYEVKFSHGHIWIVMEDDFIGRCGLTDYCLEFIDQVRFIDFPEIDMEVRADEKIGTVESDKMSYDMLSPVSGRIAGINRELETDPLISNDEQFQTGWIFKLEIKEPNELKDLMNAADYDDFRENDGRLP